MFQINTRNRKLVVAQHHGEKIRDMYEDPKYKDQGVTVNNYSFKIKDIIDISVISGISEEKRQAEIELKNNTDWKKNILFRTKLPVAEKTRLEIQDRILPALRHTKYWGAFILNAKFPATTIMVVSVSAVVAEFFRENPKYPYCPFHVWADLVFDTKKKLPNLCRMFVMHDVCVRNFIEPELEISNDKEMTNQYVYELISQRT